MDMSNLKSPHPMILLWDELRIPHDIFFFPILGAFPLLSMLRFLESNSCCDLYYQDLGVSTHRVVKNWVFHPLIRPKISVLASLSVTTSTVYLHGWVSSSLPWKYSIWIMLSSIVVFWPFDNGSVKTSKWTLAF